MSLDPTRYLRITASFLPWLMAGDHAKIQNHWLRAIGDPRAVVDDDFADSWLSIYGSTVEHIALDWHSKRTGHEITHRGAQLFHPDRAFFSSTLDGYVQERRLLVDCKAINAYRDIGEAAAFYTPQMVGHLGCMPEAEGAALLFVKGGTEPQEVPVYITQGYVDLMWSTVDRYHECIETLTPPVPLHFPTVVPPERWRTIDLDDEFAELPNWSEEMRQLLAGFGETEPYAKAHEAAKAAIKNLFPDDVGRLTHADFIIKRAKNNSVTVARQKEKAHG